MRIKKRKNIDDTEREKILTELKNFLAKEKPVIFAYLYGSFNKGNQFNDIDVAVYVDENNLDHEKDIFRYQLSLAAEAELAISGYEIDLRVMNLAPLSFKFNIVNNGQLFYCKDRKKAIQFITRTRDFYFDFQPYREFFYRKIVLGN